MSIPLRSARLCLDCETVFQEARCPSCGSESFFPLSRWVRPAMASDSATFRKTAKKASLVLLGSGLAYTAWKLLLKPNSDKKNSPE
ncbi:MAG: hypothetical protein HY648_12120 [Acidobacteria bacterium]|nr:hypothetical protein [Acidobacteriota bacterium]